MIMSQPENGINGNPANVKFFNNQEKTSYYNNDIEFEKKFIFKKLAEKNEFLQMFALRYLVYRYVNFIEPNIDQFDIDCYDLYSTYIGAFEIIGRTKRLIGTIRIINGDNESPHAEEIKRIINGLIDHKDSDLLTRPTLFPIMRTFNIPEEFLAYYSGNSTVPKEKCTKSVEISKVAVIPEYWGASPRIESGLHEIVIMESMKANPKLGSFLIAIHPRTKRRYQKLHFQIIPGTTECIYKNINQLAIAMAVNVEDLVNNPPYGNKCKSLIKTYLEKGYIEKV